jgi:hypothetical protein
MTAELTRDYATADHDLREHGCCLPESVLLAAQLTELRDRSPSRSAPTHVYDKDSQRIFSLHAKDGVFLDIIEHPIDFVREI